MPTKKTRNRRTTTIYRTKVKKVNQGDVDLETLTVESNGTFYAPAGKAYKEVVVNVGEYEKPGISLTINPSTTLYDVTVDTVKDLVITATVAKKTNTITKVEILIGGVVVKTVTEGIATGGVVTFTKSYDPATNSNISVSARVTDSANKSTSASKDIKFVGKSYYGTVNDGVTITEELLKTKNNSLVGSKAFVYSGITMDYGKVVYAYPATFGTLKSIKDVTNNIDYTKSFTQSVLNMDGLTYYYYLLNDPVAATNVQLTFA